MDASEYQRAAMRTKNTYESPHDQIRCAIFGLVGEIGEVSEPLKKLFWQGTPPDFAKIREEIGDVAWYLALLCDGLGFDLGEVMAENIEKLRARYPEGFTAERSQNRGKKYRWRIFVTVARSAEKAMGAAGFNPHLLRMDHTSFGPFEIEAETRRCAERAVYEKVAFRAAGVLSNIVGFESERIGEVGA